MKIHTIAKSALVIGLSGLSTLAIAQPTVYGKANVSLNMHDAEDTTGTLEERWKLNSNASRLGVKGDMEIEDGLKAIYKLEYEVAMDDGTAQTKTVEVEADCDGTDTVDTCADTDVSSTFKQRNIYVGLEGDFGQVIAGNFDTPLKASQGKVDRFNDLPLGDIKNVLSGEVRASNIVMYTTPKLGDFEAKLAFMPGEGTKATDDNGLADAFSGSLQFKQEDFWVSLAIDSDVKGMDNTRLTAEYAFEKAKIAAMLQSGEDVEGTVESTSYLISGQYAISDKLVAKGQFSTNTDETVATSAENDTSMVTVGADYKLAKKVKLYAYASSWEEDALEKEQSTFGLGTEVKF